MTAADVRIIALVRGQSPETCLRLAEACREGGIRAIEITFDQRSPESWRETADSVKAIRTRFGGDLHVGAGTVISSEQLSLLAAAGGEFMVAPNADPELIREAVRRGLDAIPGAFTPSEVVAAWEAGASFVKIFPANTLGPAYFKAISQPLSQIPFLAFGGIGPENVADYFRAGCVGVGVGNCLVNPDWIRSGEWGRIAAAARELAERAG